MQDIREYVVAFVTKWYVWIGYIVIGMIAHFSHMLMSHRKKSFLQVLSSTGAALFVGYLSSMYCISHCPDQGKYLVPIATLMSDKILNYLTSIDWAKLYDDLFEGLRPKK